MAVIGFLITLSILVLVHEWGHYIVARWCGVKVLAFSIGFGKVLYKRTDNAAASGEFRPFLSAVTSRCSMRACSKMRRRSTV